MHDNHVLKAYWYITMHGRVDMTSKSYILQLYYIMHHDQYNSEVAIYISTQESDNTSIGTHTRTMIISSVV